MARGWMQRGACAAIVVSLMACGETPPATPAPEDIPQPVPGDVGLAGGGKPDIARFLNVRSAGQATLSPDGRRLSYLTSTTGQPQLWVTGGGAPAQVTFGESSVTFQAWSPAGEWIAYGTDRSGDEREGFYLVSPTGFQERELLAPSEAFRVFGGWSPDGRQVAFASTERNGIDFDIYVMDVARDGSGAAPRRVHEGTGGLYVAAWRPDGGALLLTESRGEADNNVHLLDLAGGGVEAIFKPEDGASYDGFAWTPDSKGFYVATNQDRDLAGLAYYDAGTKALTWVDTPAAEVEGTSLSPDGRYLAWTVNDNGYSRLTVRDLRTGRDVAARPALPAGVYGVAFARAAPVLMVRVAGPQIAGDVWTLDAATGETRRLTESATGGLDPGRFVAPEAVSFPSWDGEVIHGLLYLPPGGSAAPPVVLAVHGGPTAQARPTYRADIQYLLTRGVAVFDLNFRGSTGYGKRFTRLDNGRLRPNAVKDMAGALDWLASSGRVDASRAAVMGGSYGGYMTLAAVAQLPDRFRAGVSFVGVSNWVTALEGASPQLKASDRIEYGNVDDPEDRAFFVELSPITHARHVRAPVMVIHGANDPRDPVTESDQFVRAIRAQGGAVEYLRFPDEGHGIRKLANRIVAYRRIAAFLQRILSPDAGAR